VTAASGFKRLAFALAAVGAAVIAAVIALSALVPRDTVRDAVLAELRAVTGLEPSLHGETSVRLFPSSDINFHDVRFGAGGGEPALTVERLSARLRLVPLLLGRVEIADVELVEPTIAVTIEPGGKTNWSALIDTLAHTLKPTASAPSFSEIRIVDGTVLLRDPAHGVSETLNDVDLSLAWPSISKSFAATGRFVWHDEPIDASVSLSDFFAALVGSQSGLKVRLNGEQLKVAFDGHVGYAPTLKIDGTLAADAASLRNTLRWAGMRPLPGGGFGRFSLKAQTKLVGGSVAFTGVNVELDGNTAEGVLSFASDGHKSLQGTLAADTLDLSPYVSTVRLLTGRQRDWSRLPISLDGLNSIDLDLRLSAAQVKISSAKLGRTAIAANLRSGKLTVTVGESQAFGGVIRGSLGLAAVDPGAAVTAQLQFVDIDLENCLGAIFGLHRLEGKGTMSVALDGTGASVLALTRSMSGSATLAGQAGALAGLNVEQLLRRLERRPLSGGGDFRTGRTPYDKLNVALSIRKGTISVDTMTIDGPGVSLAMGGSASIPARELDLKGTASLVTKTAADRTFELPFVVQGPWDDPIMLPDADLLIRRSDAAAPLLKAIRDRRNRDALRSAIDRLTARPAVTAAPAQPD
jgi:AsmA protein